MSLPIFRQRNQSIKAEFNLLLRSQMPTMLIYAKIAAEYSISEDRVRQIIRSKTPPAPPLKGGNPKSPFKGDLEGLWGPFEVTEEEMNTKC